MDSEGPSMQSNSSGEKTFFATSGKKMISSIVCKVRKKKKISSKNFYPFFLEKKLKIFFFFNLRDFGFWKRVIDIPLNRCAMPGEDSKKKIPQKFP